MKSTSFNVSRFANIQRACVGLALIVAGLGRAYAADGGKDEPLNLPELTKARDAFKATMDKAHDNLEQALDDLIEKSKDDAAGKKRIEAEKKQWLDSGKLPACCQTTTFEEAREQASTDRMRRFEQVVTKLKAQAEDAEAAKVQSELAELRRAHEAYLWRDLRCKIKLNPTEAVSAWSWQDGALAESTPGPHQLTVPICPDKPSGYQLNLSIKRTKGNGELKLALPAAGDAKSDPGLLRIDAPLVGGSASGLAWIDGKPIEENASLKQASVFSTDKAISLHIEVTPGRILVRQGETSLIDWDCTKGTPTLTQEFKDKHPEIASKPGSMVVLTSGESAFCIDTCSVLLVPNATPSLPNAPPKPQPKAKEPPPDVFPVGASWSGAFDSEMKCTATVKTRSGAQIDIELKRSNGSKFILSGTVKGDVVTILSITHTRTASGGGQKRTITDVSGSATVRSSTLSLTYHSISRLDDKVENFNSKCVLKKN